METISVGTSGFASNCHIIYSGSLAAVIDPSADAESVLAALSERSLSLSAILLTHGHFDHMLHADELRRATGAPLYVHTLDAELLGDGYKNAYSVFFGDDFRVTDADFFLGESLTLGDEEIRVIHTPGHTRGSVCFCAGDMLFTGDTLFSEGCGRCDLYGGDRRALSQSIIHLRNTFPGNTRIFCGHGESATLREALDRLNFYF